MSTCVLIESKPSEWSKNRSIRDVLCRASKTLPIRNPSESLTFRYVWLQSKRATFLVTRLSTRFRDTDMDVTVSAVGLSKGGLELSLGFGNGNLILP